MLTLVALTSSLIQNGVVANERASMVYTKDRLGLGNPVVRDGLRKSPGVLTLPGVPLRMQPDLAVAREPTLP